MLREDVEALIGSSVKEFRQTEDYFELVLDKALVTLNNRLLEPKDVVSWSSNLVGERVLDLEIYDGRELVFAFSNGAYLKMSLIPEDYSCPEAAVFVFLPRPNKIVVVQ